MDMVVQVHMHLEYIARGEDERPEVWAIHRGAQDRIRVQLGGSMWESLSDYVVEGGTIEDE